MSRKKTPRQPRRRKTVAHSSVESLNRLWWIRLLGAVMVILILIAGGVSVRNWFSPPRPEDGSVAAKVTNQAAEGRETSDRTRTSDPKPPADPDATNVSSLPLPDAAPAVPASANVDAPPGGPVPTAEEQERILRAEQIEEALRLVERFPQEQNAIYLVGLVYQEQGDMDAAIARWEQCRELNSTRADLYDSFGQAYVMKGELGLAIEMFKKAITLQPEFNGARIRLANSLMREGRFEDVITVLSTAFPLESTADDVAGSESGDAFVEGGGGPKSLDAIEWERAYLLLGQAYQERKDFERARKAFLRATEILPDSSEGHYGLARVYAALKESQQAQHHQRAFRELEQAKQDKGREVRQAYDPLRVTRQSVAHTHTDLARVYERLGDPAEAERLLRRATEVSPEDLPSRMHLAEVYERTGRNAEAVTIYQQLLQLEPDQAVHWFHWGNLHVLLRDFDSAEAAYRKTMELEPDRADGYRALAQLYLISRRHIPEAVVLARTAVDLDPSAPVYALLGDLCEQNGNLKEAIRAMQEAVRLDPGNPRYRRRLVTLSGRQ